MTSKKMDTNASALLDTPHLQPTLKPTSLLNAVTLMNALMRQITVMLVLHGVIIQAVMIIVNQD